MSHYSNYICPDIRPYWRLAREKDSQQLVLTAVEGNIKHHLSAAEAYALRYFVGKFTVTQVQQTCNKRLQTAASPNLVVKLIEKLLALEVISLDNQPELEQTQTSQSHQLKPCLQWVQPDSEYWILRNPKDVTFLQFDNRSKEVVAQIGQTSPQEIINKFAITPGELQYLLQILAATGMLVGTHPAQPKKGGKFHPIQLLFFKLKLFNPDAWLTKAIKYLPWIWTSGFAFLLCTFLGLSTAVGFNQRGEILYQGQLLWAASGTSLIFWFAILSLTVVTLHELGHAFTLKHYGGIVPEVGLLFMCLFPAAYTNTSDSYCLPKFKRILVVCAGIIVQITLAAVGLLLWHISLSGTWLHIGSFLLMAGALFTVTINLNPLAKFDGYYLAVAVTGINNLRSRAFGLYGNLLRLKPIQENWRDRLILAAYAPFSLIYIWFVFGFLFYRLADWILNNIPMTALILLIIWGIYFYFPRLSNQELEN
ncbi:MAG: M50 family metallopeptidase [Spirulinaceae cyanobacterium]